MNFYKKKINENYLFKEKIKNIYKSWNIKIKIFDLIFFYKLKHKS